MSTIVLTNTTNHRFYAVKLRGLALAFLLASLLLTSHESSPTLQAADDATYFKETQHYLSGSFRQYWQDNGGLEQFGFPLTEPFQQLSPTDGKTYLTQFFERAIFEFHPENAGTKYEVLLRLVGKIATEGRSFAPATDTASNPSRFYFPETRHSLEGPFRAYWLKWGGLAVYGYPISEPFEELNQADSKTYTVQYFERARFEFHPEFKGSRFEVLLGLLGWQQFKTASIPAEAKNPQPPDRGTPVPPVSVVPLTITPLKGPHIGYGMNVWLFGVDQERVLGLVKEAGFSWVRQQIRWDTIEPSPGAYKWQELDKIVEATSRNKIQVIFSVLASPSWAGVNGTHGLPRDPATFGNLLSQLATRYKGRVQAYEMWNEQNISRETGGAITVGPYVETLKAGYKAVKAVDPQAVVLYGGLSPTGINDANYAIDDAVFLELCYQYNRGEMRNYFDVLGAHPGSQANAPDEFWPEDAPADKTRPWTTHPSFYFRRVENLRAIMEKYGDGAKQMWLTEFGWSTKNAAKGYEFGQYNSEDDQAKYLLRAYQRSKTNYPWMGVMAMWQLNFAPLVGPDDEKGPWGLVRADWSRRPSFDALKAMPK